MDDIEKYSQQLRRLVDEYYHQQITVDDYRAQRKSLFDRIEMELSGDTLIKDQRQHASAEEKFFLKD